MEKRGRVWASLNSRRTAQVAVEYLIIMAFVLVILLIILSLNQSLMDSFSSQFRASKARIAIDDLSDAADSVYMQGVGAQTKVFVTIPSGVLSSQVSNRTMLLSLATANSGRNDIYRNLNYPVNGFLPIEEGNYWITVRSMPGYVLIGYMLIDVDPSGITLTLAPGNSSSTTITIRNVVGDVVDISLTPSIDPELNLTLDLSSLTIPVNGTDDLVATIAAPLSAEEGLYTGTITIEANTTNKYQLFTMPITVLVVGETCELCPWVCSGIVLYPEAWNLGFLTKNSINPGLFFVCNNFNSTRQISLNFSDNTFLSFSASYPQKTTSVSVSPMNCTSTYVYVNVNVSGALEGHYSPLLLASASDSSDFSSIFFELNFSGDQEPPVVNLMWPPNNYSLNSTGIIFRYNVSDLNSSISYCELYIDQKAVMIDYSITEGVSQEFNYSWISAGRHNWTVGCVDSSPSANFGIAQPRNLTVTTTIYCVTPSLVYEEDYDPQWTTEVQYFDDGLYATAKDEGSGVDHLDYPPPDYVQMEFPSMGIDSAYTVGNAYLLIRHRDFPQSGWFYDSPDRHQIECYNGKNWEIMGNYSVTDGTWTTYENSNMSSCISTADIANHLYLKMTFDPADRTNATQDIDFVTVCVNVTEGYYVFLWPMAVDNQKIVDFTSGLNQTGNTFGLNGTWADGWDWADNTYGGTELHATDFNVDPNYDGDPSDSRVGLDHYIRVNVGGRPGRSEKNPQDPKIDGMSASAAYGVEFNLTDQLFALIKSGKRAYYSFDYVVDPSAWDDSERLELGEEGWVKTRLHTINQTIWLGYDLDYASPGDSDPYNEVWFSAYPYDYVGHANYDITQYLTYAGYYYLDLGIGLGDWNSIREGLAANFDNIAITIK